MNICHPSCYHGIHFEVPSGDILNFLAGCYYVKISSANTGALPSRVCGECALCPVSCSVGFGVREKIRDIVRVREIPPEFLA